MGVDVRPREEALAIMRDARARLEQLIASLSDDEIEAPATLGGGSWSIKDLVGHLASWEERALRWLESADAYDSRSFPSTDEFNEAEVGRKATWSLDIAREDAHDIHQRVIEAIERLDDAAWLADVPVPGGEPHPRGFVVGMVLAGDEHGPFAHDLAHLRDVEAYVQALSERSRE